jgi:hypothetical protein
MNHTLRALLAKAPVELRDAFIDARAELTNPQALAQYDKDMEDMLQDREHKRETVATRSKHQSPMTKRVTELQIH